MNKVVMHKRLFDLEYEAVVALADAVPCTHPVLAHRRRTAQEQYKKLVPPSSKDFVTTFLQQSLYPLAVVEASSGMRIADGALLSDTQSTAGNVHAESLPQRAAQQGLFIADVSTALAAYPSLLGKMHEELHGVSMLVDAAGNRSLVVIVEDGICVQTPLDLAHEAAQWNAVSAVTLEKIYIFVGRNAQIIVHDEPAHSGVAVRSLEYHLAEGARVHLTYAQMHAATVYDATHLQFFVADNAQLEVTTTFLSAAVQRFWCDVYLQGALSTARIHGAYALADAQRLSIDVAQYHEGKKSMSDINIGGTAAGSARIAYHGVQHTAQSASGTQAAQHNTTLLLGKQARASSIPTLEVLTSDVHCTHASAIGRLEKETLYFLQARGMTDQQAYQLLLEGFFAERYTMLYDGNRGATNVANLLSKTLMTSF